MEDKILYSISISIVHLALPSFFSHRNGNEQNYIKLTNFEFQSLKFGSLRTFQVRGTRAEVN